MENIINEVDILLHLFKHNCLENIVGGQMFVYINQLIEILEYEIEIFNSTVANKCNFATKFALIEKIHIDHNKVYDLYSTTKYPHRLFNLSFEKPRPKFVYTTFGSSNKASPDYLKQYYKHYLEESMNIQMELRFDYDEYLSDLFPNHDQHIELMILILYLLAQFCSNETIQENSTSQLPEEDVKKVSATLSITKSRITMLMMC